MFKFNLNNLDCKKIWRLSIFFGSCWNHGYIIVYRFSVKWYQISCQNSFMKVQQNQLLKHTMVWIPTWISWLKTGAFSTRPRGFLAVGFLQALNVSRNRHSFSFFHTKWEKEERWWLLSKHLVLEGSDCILGNIKMDLANPSPRGFLHPTYNLN